MIERNAGLSADQRIDFRIGIHLGDVVEESDGDLMGDGVNIAAAYATGDILIVNADDQFPVVGWDAELLSVRGATWRNREPLQAEFVIEVDCGGYEHARGIMPMPILSRARYEQQGYVFFPVYESMCADNDFCECARQDGVVIEALHLLFHRGPLVAILLTPSRVNDLLRLLLYIRR
jgi:hypothetical protein